MSASEEYQAWWEKNKERILEEDSIRHELDSKQHIVNNLDDVNLNENE